MHSGKYSNSYDHVIEWVEDGSPSPGQEINYGDGNAPLFKQKIGAAIMNNDYETKSNSLKGNAFESIADFQSCIRRNGEVEFDYLAKSYSITHVNNKILFVEAYNEDSEAWYDNSEDLLNHVIEGKKLREFITEVTVWFRSV